METQKENWRTKLKSLIKLKFKFALTGLVATSIDYVLYLSLVYTVLKDNAVIANLISYGIAVIINFFMQKRYVFDNKRTTSSAFMISIFVSGGGLLLSSLMIAGLINYTFFNENQWLTKLLVTATIFFYNFYLKRFAFEKRFL